MGWEGESGCVVVDSRTYQMVKVQEDSREIKNLSFMMKSSIHTN
jgi:hypothetical protein